MIPFGRRLGRALETVAWLSMAMALVRFFPFRWYARHLGRLEREPSAAEATPSELARAQALASRARAVARHFPVQPSCLAQAVALLGMLSTRGIPGRLCLGVRAGPDGGLLAHAWLRAGTTIVLGQSGRELYTPIACFASGKG